MKIESLVPWPEHVLAVFRTVGKLMEGKQLRPEHLSAIQPKNGSIIADHEVTVSHIPKARTGGKQGRYVVVIEGPRITGRWDLLPGAMDQYCREAALASENVS